MYILVDPSEKDRIKIIGFDETNIETEVFDAINREILFSLDYFLLARKMDKKNVQGIAVVVGVGGFTSTRLATTLANAWHFVENIPLLAISVDEVMEPQKLIKKFNLDSHKSRGLNVRQYILAEYSGEPNIGL